MTEIICRYIELKDKENWHLLWRKYLDFYNSVLSDEIYTSTFYRFFDAGKYEPRAIVAEQIIEGESILLGLVHYMPHRHCWHFNDVCYLQDLYIEQSARGRGLGRKLIQAVYDEAIKQNWENVYWMTAEDNMQGRHLYDKVGELTPFIKYQKPK